MLQTLNTYPNRYFDPIDIPRYTVVEIYKDSIVAENTLGYCIVPLGDLDNTQIEQKIRNYIADSQPSGYTSLAMLAGRERKDYDNRVTYAVWYNGGIMPSYPERPIPVMPPELGSVFNRFNSFNIFNEGTAEANLKLTLTIEKTGLVEIYINNDLFTIQVDHIPTQDNLLVLSKNGVTFNDKEYSVYDFPCVPTVKRGLNVVQVSKDSVSKVKVEYTPNF